MLNASRTTPCTGVRHWKASTPNLIAAGVARLLGDDARHRQSYSPFFLFQARERLPGPQDNLETEWASSRRSERCRYLPILPSIHVPLVGFTTIRIYVISCIPPCIPVRLVRATTIRISNSYSYILPNIRTNKKTRDEREGGGAIDGWVLDQCLSGVKTARERKNIINN